MSLSTPTVRIRIPFFWWQREVASAEVAAKAAARAKAAAETDGYLRCDTSYIPSSTADLWRTARYRAA
jgi:hypothetical protein